MMDPLSLALWQKAHDALRPEDRPLDPQSLATDPEELTALIEKRISESKGKPIKLPNKENLFIRDILQKLSRWVKKIVEVGDVAVQYDPGHASLPWALVRLVLQLSLNNVEKHAAVLEGIERVSFYLMWSKIEQAYLAPPFKTHAQLELDFVQLYTTILTFTARSLNFLKSKPHRIAAAFYSSDSEFRRDLERMAAKKQSIETYTRQISDQNNQEQYAEIKSIKAQLADLDQLMTRTEQIIQSTSATIDRFENQQILDWASEIPYQEHLKVVHKKALEGTGEWLFQDPEFCNWRDSSRSQILWLHGSAGSGKSTLISMIIQSLIEAHKTQQAAYPIYFFCARTTSEPERADPEYILRCLMRQSSDLPGGPPLHHTLKKRFDKRRVEGNVSAEEAARIIIDTLESRLISYIMIDALDECDRQKRDVLLDILKSILTDSNSLVKIFVTSRSDHYDIKWSMNGFPALCIDASRNQEDIIYYVNYGVQIAINKKRLLPTEKMTTELQQKIVDSLCKGADGMFRWVEMQLEFLCTLRMRKVLLKRLENLPPGLEKIYTELYEFKMEELGEEQAEVVQKVLSWLLVAKEPLRTFELCQLICAPDEADMSVETVLDITFDLVRHDQEQDQFRFSHLSVREFLEKRQEEFSQRHLHGMATRACLSQLTSGETINKDMYAAFHWPFHAEDAIRRGGVTIIEQQLSNFLRIQNSCYRDWRDEMLKTKIQGNYRRDYHMALKLSRVLLENGSPLLITACFGFSAQLAMIMTDSEHPIDTESTNEEGESALYLASEYNALDSVRVLLDKSADINAQNSDINETALQAASREGHYEMVKLLLIRDAEIDCGTLPVASLNGHYEIVKLLLDNGADINAQSGNFYRGTAVQAASWSGEYEIVKLLLDNGADVNAQGGLHSNALQAASYEGHEGIVKLLLNNGADINAQGGDYGNALQAASRKGHEGVVKLLLDNGAAVNAQGGVHVNALRAASYEGHERIVELLLNKGADVNAMTGDRGSALQAASLKGHKEVASILLQNGAHPSICGGFYGSAFFAAYLNLHDNIVELISATGTVFDVKTSNSLGCTLLHIAARFDSRRGIQLALKHGVGVNTTDNYQWTALHWGAYFGCTDAVEFLLEREADPTLRDRQHRTPYQIARLAGPKVAAKIEGHLALISGVREYMAPYGHGIGARCDYCRHELVENHYYHCRECSDDIAYDLCFRCIRDAHLIHQEHEFTSNFRYEWQD